MKTKVVRSADELCDLIIEMLESKSRLTQDEMLALNYAKETKNELTESKNERKP